MKITHHPDDSTLMSYAAGSLTEALAAVVRAHVCLCPVCAKELRTLELIGACLLDNIDQAPVSRAPPVITMRSLEADVIPGHSRAAADPEADVPWSLRELIGTRLDDIHWKRLGMGVWHVPLKLSHAGESDLRLLRVAPGQAMPEHGHGGTELTLILQGAYSDRFGDYHPGDIADLDSDVEHSPIADSKLGCVCIIASEQRAHFKGFFGRIVQPLTGL